MARGELESQMSLVEWRSKLADSGWGDTAMAARMVRARPASRPGANGGRGIRQRRRCRRCQDRAFRHLGSGHAARAWNGFAQKKKFLRRILTGEDAWCQLFSEPGSGSDLAGATTRAEFDGERWMVNGQKVWTTSAHHADYGLLLARTDWDVPKHKGMSYFVIDRQPGVDVQPLHQMNGHASFNQVFFTDARIPAENLLSGVGDGWKVAMTTLAHERRGADGLTVPSKRGVRVGRIYVEEQPNLKPPISPTNGIHSAPGALDLDHRARQGDRRERRSQYSPGNRQTDDHGELGRMDRPPRASAAQQQGKPQGPEGSFGKLAASNVARAAARVHTMISRDRSDAHRER